MGEAIEMEAALEQRPASSHTAVMEWNGLGMNYGTWGMGMGTHWIANGRGYRNGGCSGPKASIFIHTQLPHGTEQWRIKHWYTGTRNRE